MRKYIHFSAIEFLSDPYFIDWMKTSSPIVSQAWEEWLALNPSKAKEVERAKLLYCSLQYKSKVVSEREIDQEWSKLSAAQAAERNDQVDRAKPWYSWLWKAASILLILGGMYGGRLILKENKNAASLITTVAKNGERISITLSDGSKIRLNAGSKFTYPRVFSNKSREVSLEGEAFFDITRDEEKPFIVKTGAISTQVLGTSFSIRAYEGQSDIKVAVISGKVKVSTDHDNSTNQEVFIDKDEMVTFRKSENQLTLSGFDENDQVGWKDGMLYFKQADFSQIVERLELWYDVKIQLSEDFVPDPEWRYSGKFNNKPIDYILNTISYPNLFQYEIYEKTIRIKSK